MGSLTVVGLLGGIGSGKSTVARFFGELGARVLDADREAQAALDEPEVIERLCAFFGAGILDDSGRIDRARLADVVFQDAGGEARQRLEGVVHPQVRARLAEALERARRETPPPPMVVLDVPLLLEGPVASWCDRLVFIETPEADRRSRTAKDRGWEEGELARRERAQIAVEEKRERAHFRIPNDGTREELRERVKDTYEELVSRDRDPGHRGDQGTSG